jgi:hypothetical protein
MRLTAWTEDKPQGCVMTPNGPVFAKRDEVVFVVVTSREESDRLLLQLQGRGPER